MSDPGRGGSDAQKLTAMLAARHPCITIQTLEEEHALSIIRTVAADIGTRLRIWSYTRGVHDGFLIDETLPGAGPGAKDTESPAGALYYLICQKNAGIVVLLDMLDHVGDPKVLRLLRDLIHTQRQIRGHVILVSHAATVPPVIAAEATPLELSLPDEEELKELVLRTARRVHHDGQGLADTKISRHTLDTIVRNLRGLTRRQSEQIVTDAVVHDRRLSDEDVNHILASKRRMLQRDGLLEYIESPVALDEIAGMANLKRWLAERQWSFSDEAALRGLHPPRGVLMLGVPGAGKSLCAKAVATAWSRPLLRMDPSVLYDRYIGESERRLRDALHQAEAMSPIVLWIDEIEKGFASAASHSVDGGLSQRMFGSLLTWMQEHTSPVFLFATANNIDALPPELLRKGRFDEIFFVDLPGPAVRRAVIDIHLRKRRLDPAAFDLEALAAACEGFTGSEIEQAIIAAMHRAIAGGSEPGTAGLLEAMRTSPPLSVTASERIDALRDWASDRCVPAD